MYLLAIPALFSMWDSARLELEDSAHKYMAEKLMQIMKRTPDREKLMKEVLDQIEQEEGIKLDNPRWK
jgi:uncharacterized membrane protein